MRVLVLAVVLLLLPGAAAQAVDDPAGDHEIGVAPLILSGEASPQWIGAPEGEYQEADVLGFRFIEGAETVDVTFVLADAMDPEATQRLDHIVTFDHHGARYGLKLLQDAPQGTLLEPKVVWGPVVTRFTDEQDVATVYSVPAKQDGASFTATLDKRQMIDPDRVPLRPGDTLSDPGWSIHRWGREPMFCARTSPPNPGFSVTSCGLRYRDDVDIPDLPIEQAPPSTGHLLLDALNPLRVSNGAATSYIVNVTLHNLGGPADTVRLQAGDVPAGWDVIVPRTVDLPAGGETGFPVTVSVPFEHEHGATKTFDLVAASSVDEGIRSGLELGVLWTEVPQPTRHHPRLYMHTEDFMVGTMSTQEQDGDTEMHSGGGFSCCEPRPEGTHEVRHFFNFHLEPLLVGLQFDGPGVQGTADFRLERGFAGEMSVDLFWDGDGERRTLASMPPVPVDWDAGEHTATFELTVEDEELRVPFQGDAGLEIEIRFEGQAYADAMLPHTDGQSPFHMLPGGFIDLPLADYHEIDDAATTGGLVWDDSNRTVKVNPGRTAVWAGALRNDGAERHVAFQASAPGLLVDAAPDSARMDRGDTTVVAVQVDVPADVTPGRWPVIVSAVSEDGLATTGFELLVTNDEDIPDRGAAAQAALDEAESRSKSKESPVGAWPVVALALLVAVRRKARSGSR